MRRLEPHNVAQSNHQNRAALVPCGIKRTTEPKVLTNFGNNNSTVTLTTAPQPLAVAAEEETTAKGFQRKFVKKTVLAHLSLEEFLDEYDMQECTQGTPGLGWKHDTMFSYDMAVGITAADWARAGLSMAVRTTLPLAAPHYGDTCWESQQRS